MHEFIRTITRSFVNAVIPALIVMAVGVIVLAILYWKWYGKKGEDARVPFLKRAAAILLLLCYLGGLGAITLLLRMDGARLGVQTHFLLAFWEAWNAFTLQVWLNPLLNIAMFVPLGVLLPLSAKPFRKWYWMLAAGAGTSLVIEILQYLLGRGQADIDDLFCNTLGAMLGYCLCMVTIRLLESRWRPAAGYAVLPVLSAAALAGIFLAYYLQPYGNLAGPIYPADTSGTTWVLDCELSDAPGPAGVYWTEPFTKETCDAFAIEFLGRVGAEIDFDRDVNYYDNTTYYGDHHTYCLIVNHNDRSYRYSDYRVDPDLRFDKWGTSTQEQLRADLLKLGIDVPEAAEFTYEGKGNYTFHTNRAVEDGVFTNGDIRCRVAEGGALYEVENFMTVGVLRGEGAVISEQAAYELLCAGRFAQQDVYGFEYYAPKEVHVIDCTLKYFTDSKGFQQPVYNFTLSGLLDEQHRWMTFVPALA